MQSILDIKQTCLVGKSSDMIKTYLKDNGYEWKDWYFNSVYTPAMLINNLQYWKKSSEYIDYISPCDVIGHNHDGLSDGYDWITLLSSFSRNKYTDTSSVLKQLNEQDNVSDDCLIHLEKYGDHYFFSEGRHRMVQAKFLEVEVVRCRVTEYVFDEHAYDLYCRIQSKATIKSQENWTTDSPVSATVEEISFIIPMEDKAVELLEQSIAKANSINRRPLCRFFYTMHHGYRKDQCLCFNLKFPQTPEKIVSALVHSMRK